MTRVLLAEDDASISEPLARALRREGYEVEVRQDGPTALDAGLRGGVDLVVLHLGLPVMDAWEEPRRLRSDGHTVPSLILT
ncbi:chemotaxis protein CheY, partial [Streptomyces sp. NRRL F-6602]